MHAGSIVDETDARTDAAPDAEQLRTHVHAMWGSVAPAWADHAEYLDARHARAAQQMLDATAPLPGERVLELACGPGGLGLAAAERVGADGEVVMSDVAAEMTAIAARRAAARGVANVSTTVIDLDRIEQPSACYDVVLCREGLMFASDPAAAVRDVHRVLRPGGRVAFSVWGPRSENPWMALIFEAVGEQLGRPVPPPGIPGPFALEDRDALAALLRDAGLAEVSVQDVDVPMRVASFEEWWARTTALAGPLAVILAAMPRPAVEALRAQLRTATAPFATAAGDLEFPGVALLATGRRP
jgi:ubiquinone/menaquinone biosynthesis C-methylase UbiE